VLWGGWGLTWAKGYFIQSDLAKGYSKTQQRLVGPAAGSTLTNLARMRWDHIGQRIPFKYWLKMPNTWMLNLIYSPFNLYESLRFRRQLKELTFEKPPIFILGHWRSGTTHLHNLLAQDPHFGFTTTLQCMFPNSFLSNPLARFFLKKFMPETRPMDNMKLSLDTPQEEEVGMANMVLHSFYNAWAFPKAVWKDYLRYVRFEGESERQVSRWERGYLRMLKKASLYQPGRQLVLKNPANTGRIPQLLKLFPDAKFIHIYRHPVNVFYSTRRLYESAIPQYAHQQITQAEGDEAIFNIYNNVMKAYFQERELIPKENLVEIRYEDLEENRMDILKGVYDHFNWSGWDTAAMHMTEYLDSLGTYTKNVHPFSKEECKLVEQKWAFSFEALGYGPQP